MKADRRLFNLTKGAARFEAKAPTESIPRSQVYLYDEISYFGVTAGDFVAELAYLNGADFDLHVNSPGGDVFDGLAILEVLRAYPGEVTAYVDGIAASAASFILMGASEVVVGRNAEIMVHDAWGMCMGNAADMVDMAARLNSMSDNIASIYSLKAGNASSEWREIMRDEGWYTGQAAVDVGLADRVAGDVAVNDLAYDLARFKNHRSPEPIREPERPVVDVAALFDNAYRKVRA